MRSPPPPRGRACAAIAPRVHGEEPAANGRLGAGEPTACPESTKAYCNLHTAALAWRESRRGSIPEGTGTSFYGRALAESKPGIIRRHDTRALLPRSYDRRPASDARRETLLPTSSYRRLEQRARWARVCRQLLRRPQSRRDYPLNLSILISGGKETNKDFLSSGERTGKSPAPNPAVPPQGVVVFGRIRLSLGVAPRPSPS